MTDETNRRLCFEFTLGDSVEGGWNHIKDARGRDLDLGGETYNGIARNFHPRERIWTELDARRPHRKGAVYPELEWLVVEFYVRKFWEPSNAALFAYPLSLTVFDHAVNAGHPLARKAVQRAVGATPDGKIGPLTIAAVRAKSLAIGVGNVCDLALDQRVQSFVRSIRQRPRQLAFLLGWWRRTLLLTETIHRYSVEHTTESQAQRFAAVRRIEPTNVNSTLKLVA